MNRTRVGLLALLAAGVFSMTADSQPPDGKDRPAGNRGGPGGPGGPPGGPGGPPGGMGGTGMGFGRFEVGRLIGPPIRQELKLTEEQEKQLVELEKSVKERLAKILTADQMKRLENFRPRFGRGGLGGAGFGPGGPGGPGAGPGDRGRPPAGDRPDGNRPPDGDRGRPRGNPDNPPPPNDDRHQS